MQRSLDGRPPDARSSKGLAASSDRNDTHIDVLLITTVAMSLGFLDGLVGSLAQQQLKVGVVCSPDVRLVEFGRRHGVSAWPVKMSRRITPLQDVLALWQLARVMRAVRPVVVHAQTPKAGLLGVLAAVLTRVPVCIYHMRGLPAVTATGFKRWLLDWSERCACALSDRVLCVGPSLRSAAIARSLCPPDKITVPRFGSGQGVDGANRFNPANVPVDVPARLRDELGIPRDAPVVGFVGRVVRDKGIVELEEAWRSIRSTVPAARLIIIGPTESEDPVPPEVLDALEADPRVHLLGERTDTPSYYATMDVCVLPSHREGFPNVPLEAAAMELPVVTSNCIGCIDAVVDGVTGAIVPVGDSCALASAILQYLFAPDLAQQHGRAGRKRALTDFEPRAVFRAIHDVYNDLTRSKHVQIGDAARKNVSTY